jgi:predicted permease
MAAAGSLIWSSVKPMLQTYLILQAGTVRRSTDSCAKTGHFSATAAKGMSQYALYIALPCLMFAAIVPSFTKENIQAFAPLITSAFTYQALGAAFGFLIREVAYVVRRVVRRRHC